MAMPHEHIADKALQQEHDQMFKLIIIGDTGVGKSCLMKRVMDDEFKTEHQVTIGVEFGSYGLRLEDKIVKMQIWDTAGQESYKSVTRIFYRGAHCVFLTYDVTRRETFDSLEEWHREVRQHAADDVLVYLVGNKAEMEDASEVPFDAAKELAKTLSVSKCFETSAKTGQAVEDVFSCAGKDIFSKVKNNEGPAALRTNPTTPV